MRQTIVSVVLTVKPAQFASLREEIERVRQAVAAPDGTFPVLKQTLPTLHFLSIVAFDARAGVAAADPPETPLLVVEANFDGAPGPFWAALEAPMGELLRGLLRLCQPPSGPVEAMFAAVTRAGARAPVAPLLERLSVFPEARHVGARGYSQVRIQRHDALFRAAEAALPPPAPVLAEGAAAIHAWLREAMLPQFPWLGTSFEPPISAGEEMADGWIFWLFVLVALVCAVLPWWVLGRLLHPAAATVVALAAGIFCLTRLQDIGDLLAPDGAKGSPVLWSQCAGILGIVMLLPIFVLRSGPFAWLLLLAAGVLASVLIVVAALRHREQQDLRLHPPPDAKPDPVLVRQLEAWEDCHLAGADHMGSAVTIKPGKFRGFLIRFAMTALTLALRHWATDGYLQSMRTIHFAHWAIVDGGRRLLFFSNFDGSWESYLDDFIEKAHAGLTLAWGNCVGFPPPRYLLLDGAMQGRKFKNWARSSMTPSTFWYAAYPNLTVNQIMRQADVARGLCSPRLSGAAADAWVKEL
jgi:hypothetical protein